MQQSIIQFAEDRKDENDISRGNFIEENDLIEGEEMIKNGTCGNSATWTVDTRSETLTISGTGAMNDYRTATAPWYDYWAHCQNITIEDGITSIGEGAFYYCSIRSITIPNSVTSIAAYAFSECNGFNWSIVIPDSVISLADTAFQRCTKITSISFGNGITSIGNSALNGCTELTSITFGEGITSIGKNAFYGCSKVTSVTFMGDQPTFGSKALAFQTDSSGTLITTIYSKGWASNSVFPKTIRGNGTFVYKKLSSSPGIPVNVGGTWKNAAPYVNVDGTWKKVTNVFVNVDGTWKEVGK